MARVRTSLEQSVIVTAEKDRRNHTLAAKAPSGLRGKAFVIVPTFIENEDNQEVTCKSMLTPRSPKLIFLASFAEH